MNVVLMIFNRPENTARVFQAIRAARPGKLLVVADGPRQNVPEDLMKVALTRKVVAAVDWPCEVLINYSQKNMGCRLRVASGLTWVFEQVEDAIILEDDCLPHPSFFEYCNDLLEYYRDDEKIMHIGGNNFQNGKRRGWASYYFSKYTHIWGWATWRRAWQLYDAELVHWSEHGAEVLARWCERPEERRYWAGILTMVLDGRINTWDAPWLYTCWANDGLSIVPAVNLVSNIGFGGNSSHTSDAQSPFAEMTTSDLKLPLRHPRQVSVDRDADLYTCNLSYVEVQTFWYRVFRRIMRMRNQGTGGAA